MANTERVESLISKEALAQFGQLKDLTDANVLTFEKLVAKAVELNSALGGAKTFKDIASGMKEVGDQEKLLAKQVSELAAANDKLQKLYETQSKKLEDLAAKKRKFNEDDKAGLSTIEKAQKKLDESYSAQARKLAEVKEQQNLVNQANKLSAKETLGLATAYDQLTLEYNAAAKEAKNLAVQFGAGSKEAKEASARALELDVRLKAADANVGRFNKNVGNYSGAIGILQKSLNEVNKKLSENAKSGNLSADAVQMLTKEQSLLNQFLDRQQVAFSSVSQEIRTNTLQLQQMAAAGLQGTEAYRTLFAATSELKDETSDLKKALTNAAPDDVAFNAAADAARGLVGVYGLAKSVSAAFGTENEALQQTMVKLQAAETALQSIEAIRAVFKKENAVRQAINIGLQKIETFQTNLQTASESKNIIVKYASIIAQKALNAVMLANPILLVLTALIGLTAILVSFTSANKEAAISFEGLNRQFEEEAKNLDTNLEKIKRNAQVSATTLSSRHASEVALGKDSIKFLESQQVELKQLEDRWFITGQAAQTALRKFENRSDESLSDTEKEQKENAEKIVSGYTKYKNDLIAIDQTLKVERIKLKGQQSDAVIKAAQDEIDATKSHLQVAAANQQAITSNEQKTFSDRLTALKHFGQLQEQIINADAQKQSLTPGQTPTELKLIETNRANAIVRAQAESAKRIEDITRTENEKIRKANLEILKIALEDNVRANEAIVNNEKKSYGDRLDAAYSAFTQRRSIAIAEHEEAVKDKTLNAEQLKAIEKKYASDINQLMTDYLATQLTLVEQNQEQQTEALEKEQEKRENIISKEASLGVIGLNQALRDGNISIAQYSQERAKIESDARIKTLKEEQAKQTGLVLATKEGTKEREAALKELAATTLQISDEVTSKQIADLQKFNEALKQLANEGFELLSTVLLSGYERQTQAVDKQIDALERQKQKDIEVANSTITNEQDKAATIATIEARAAAQKEQLEIRKKRIEYERARTERAITIGRIIADTAAAVIAALGSKPYTPANIALAAATGAIGAAQLAKVIATPLPQFEHGTMDAPGGNVIVGEKRSELIVTPEGKTMVTPPVATVMNVPKHSIIYPDARAIMEGGLAVNKSGKLIETKNDNKRVEQKLDKLTSVIKNKPVMNISADQGGLTAMWQYGANWVAYVEDQTKF